MIINHFSLLELGLVWSLLFISTTSLGIYRTLIDRIRSGLVSAPDPKGRIAKTFHECLKLPNHERPFHIEASLLSSLQVIFGFLFFSRILTDNYDISGLSAILVCLAGFLFSLVIERLTAWLYPLRISQSNQLELHLKLGFLPVLITKALCFPLTWLLSMLEKQLQSTNQKIMIEKEEGSEVADHIRIVGREGTNLDPDILEIMGNTIEMSQLKVNDVMIPRNQVQILDSDNSFSQNLEIAKSCGHTRLPLCLGNLDHCLGIIHVKYVFRSRVKNGEEFDLKNITKAPAQLLSEEPLMVALKRMMKLKVHMALVRDEFGGIDGVITLEDILEEVVGEIKDEFDADEEPAESLGDSRWRISGLVPVHELPESINQFESEDDLATIGGVVTKELGRIPEKGENVTIKGMQVSIIDADDTRVLLMEIDPIQKNEHSTSSEKESSSP